MCGTVALIFAVFLGNAAAADNCQPYGHPEARLCTTHGLAYNDLRQQMTDAQHQESFPAFIVNTTLGMHQYLYPCHSLVEAALRLFYANIPLPDRSSPWWGQMAVVMGIHDTTPLVGRRRRAAEHFTTEDELLRSSLDKIRTETTHGENCIQALINEFKGYAAAHFHSMYTQFVEPPTADHTTTLAPATTTTHPTTTTTTHPPTTHPHAPVAARCTTCSGITCLLSPTVATCSSNLQEFCLTTVASVQTNLEIIRGCATRGECNSHLRGNNPECNTVETQVLSSGVTCRYCCFGDNCNHPPQMLPAANTIYHGQ